MLQRAMEVPGLSLEVAVLLVDYHINRNEIAARRPYFSETPALKMSRVERGLGTRPSTGQSIGCSNGR